MPILKNIQRIKIIAPCLFFIPLVALFLSLFLNNHLLIYGKSSVLFFPEGEIKFGKFKCNEKNNFCQKQKENDKLTYCSKFKYHYNFSIDGKAPIKVHDSDLALIKNIPFEVEIIEDKNIIIKSCIKNSILYKFYELIPFAGNIFLWVDAAKCIEIRPVFLSFAVKSAPKLAGRGNTFNPYISKQPNSLLLFFQIYGCSSNITEYTFLIDNHHQI